MRSRRSDSLNVGDLVTFDPFLNFVVSLNQNCNKVTMSYPSHCFGDHRRSGGEPLRLPLGMTRKHVV